MSNQTTPPFWLVWCEDGGSPTFRHPDEMSAAKEAQRLAERHPGKSFVVLCPIARITHRHTVIERFDPLDDGIPF